MDKSTTLALAERCKILSSGTYTININDIPYHIKIETLPLSIDFNKNIQRMMSDYFTHIKNNAAKEGICENKIIQLKNNETKYHEISPISIDSMFELGKRLSLSWYDDTNTNEDLKFLWRPLITKTQILPLICIIKTNKEYIFIKLIDNEFIYNIKKISLFSYQNYDIFSQQFHLIICQMLNIFYSLSIKGIFPVYNLNDFIANKNLWFQLNLIDIIKNISNDCINFEKKIVPSSVIVDINQNSWSLEELTKLWRHRKLSNFDYIIKLNEFAGRTKDDLNYYPIMPWVCDFTSETGGWRCLDKTKYRIVKGDDQLKEQYNRFPSHHIPELLSDICVMSYRARVESKEKLCQIVRRNWEPNEYPRSIEKMYTWSPDECIPEFYSDPKIFCSIHEDMNNLELPYWTKTEEQFIKWHKDMLESEEVSENLHKWIDLTFGYLLTGQNAVDALNVHLSYIRKSDDILRTYGVVQLFTSPHPKRFPQSNRGEIIEFLPLYNDYLPSDENLTVYKEGENFNLKQLLIDIYSSNDFVPIYVESSLTSIAVCIVELCLPENCRDLLENAPFEQRLKRARFLFNDCFYKLPRNLASTLKKFLFNNIPSTITSNPLEVRNPLINHFNLSESAYVANLLLLRYYSIKYKWKIAVIKNEKEKCRELVKNQVDILWELIGIEGFDSLWVDLFISLITINEHALSVCFLLFSRVTTCDKIYHPKLIAAVKKLYDDFNLQHDPSIIKLLDRRFLLQLCIRFGTRIFTKTFLKPIIKKILYSSDPGVITVAKESSIWLAKRFGPIITVSTLIPELLKLFEHCYTKVEDIFEVNLDIVVNGDENVSNITDVLIEITVMYGPSIIINCFLPYFKQLFLQASTQRLIQTQESLIISSNHFLLLMCNCLFDNQLMDNLHTIIDDILLPAVKILSSSVITFSSTSSRRLYASKLLKWLHLLACRIGSEIVQRFMQHIIQRLFCNFSIIYSISDTDGIVIDSKNSTPQLLSIFDTKFAKLCLHIFSQICGHRFIQYSLPDSQLIIRLAGGKPSLLSTSLSSTSFSSSPNTSFLENQMNPLKSYCSMDNGNDNIAMSSPFSVTSNINLYERMSNESYSQLTNNYVSAIEKIKEVSSSIDFYQIPLSTFHGHQGSIKKICIMDNENCFISASSDKTIKLWSIKSSEDVSQCQWSYKYHTKSLYDASIIANGGLVASTDGILNIWDPFKGCTLSTLDWCKTTKQNVPITTLSPLTNYTMCLSSISDTLIKLCDVRTGNYLYHICPMNITNNSSQYNIKTMALSPCESKIVASLYNGSVVLCDIRTGKIISLSMQSHSDCYQIEWISMTMFACLFTDHHTSIWTITPRLRLINKLQENASTIIPENPNISKQFMTLYNMNRVKIYTDSETCEIEKKIRSDEITSVICSGARLYMNKMWLFGSSNGIIKLYM
ncbi:BEACH domain and WD40 repeat and WD40/YVTN repeat-like-containing domain and WD40-repeat-containing domain-containing protein [Strongyloides ratti]|uniref:BEACH domain and WD40 repeat and WD40/YVTN repeat-like-containing domain and WD40-repeat-containing domain-containing protein n=1 Tax=Strongyloides ratti TaxID=34506 RepID=A0A090LF35_STRRB|nr:BEACH domain and WD40 repeat and WD40/YVTN repeat-like-containing domain and WD40-repeat-containing domain-containing protein [Strongyloides ratti]CEF68406.1 BEACH domain and WD40 repeat and WD40/YVTN repeat-like-containing domain and WD40-repeat-containing domain-containing protein [Strongyloides ratti]